MNRRTRNIEIVIGARDAFTGVFRRATGAIANFTRQGRRFINDMASKSQTAFLAVSAAASASIAAITKIGGDINREMANIGTLIPGQIGRLKTLKSEVQDLSIEIGVSTSDLTRGLFKVISASGDSAESMDKLKIAVIAAKAGIATTEESLTLLNSVTKAYNNTNLEAIQKVADLAFQTNKLGDTSFKDLANSISDVVPLSAQLGQSQEELFTIFATLTGVTGNASKVATQFASILSELIKPNTKLAGALKELEFSTVKEAVATIGLVGVLKKLKDIAGGSSEEMAKLFGSSESLKAIFPLLSTQADNYALKSKEMKDVTGALNEAFREQTDGIDRVGHQLNITGSVVKTIFQNLNDILEPFIFNVLGLLGTELIYLKGDIQGNTQAIQKFIKDGLLFFIRSAEAAVDSLLFFRNAWGGINLLLHGAVVGLSKVAEGIMWIVKFDTQGDPYMEKLSKDISLFADTAVESFNKVLDKIVAGNLNTKELAESIKKLKEVIKDFDVSLPDPSSKKIKVTKYDDYDDDDDPEKVIKKDNIITMAKIKNSLKRIDAERHEKSVIMGANKALEFQMLRMIELGEFSTEQFIKQVAQQAKAELASMAAKATLWALYETAMGFAYFGTPIGVAHFTAAANFAAIAGASLVAAKALHSVSGDAPGGPAEIKRQNEERRREDERKRKERSREFENGDVARGSPLPSTDSDKPVNTVVINLRVDTMISPENMDDIVENHIGPSFRRLNDRNVVLNVKN